MLGPKSEEAVRRAAHQWSMRMHSDDASAYRQAFERWRAADPRHHAAYARLEQQWSQAALLAQTRIGRTRALPRRSANRLGAPIGYALALAATVLVVGLGLFLRAPLLVGNHAPPASQLASRVGEIRNLRLADGSLVTLDTDSAVRVAFSPEVRRIVLTRGRARFDVTHNPNRPFIVLAGTGAVVARGTVFDVSLLGGRVGVTLLRGVVDVRRTTGGKLREREHSAVRLHPGQRTDFTASEPPQSPQIAEPAESNWVSGMLSFDADRLGDALGQANRYSAAKIIVADPALNELKITGAYRVRDAAAFAHALAASLDLEATREPGGNIILSRPT